MANTKTTAQAVEVTTQKSTVDESKVKKYKADLKGLYDKHKTHSGVMRFLKSEGLSTSEIAQITDKRYQHVRNVLKMPLEKKTQSAA